MTFNIVVDFPVNRQGEVEPCSGVPGWGGVTDGIVPDPQGVSPSACG